MAAIMEQVAPHAGGTIIDAGCGKGALAVLLKRRARDARVMDIALFPYLLALANRNAARVGVEGE